MNAVMAIIKENRNAGFESLQLPSLQSFRFVGKSKDVFLEAIFWSCPVKKKNF